MKVPGSWWRALAVRLPGPRSNGVRVRRGTIPHIRAGNAARARRDWPAAALAYRAALAREPGLIHLWIQLGHMEKEMGQPDRAAAAYTQAAERKPSDAEPLLHLGHLAKRRAGPAAAAGHFAAALRRAPGDREAAAELVRLLPDRDDAEPAAWAEMLGALGIDPDEQRVLDADPVLPGATLLDVTDLLAFWGVRRLPTGIQRVQIEVTLACLDEATGDPAAARPVFCVYASARRGWVGLPDQAFADVCRLAKAGDDAADPAWAGALDRLYRRIAVARTIRPAGGVLVNLGTSWSDRNHLLDVRGLRSLGGTAYLPLVFDLIPLIGPEWFTALLVGDYRAWFESLLHSADGFLAISEATRRDLLDAAAATGVTVPPAAVSVVRLDGNFRQPPALNSGSPTSGPPSAGGSEAVLAARGLASGGYVLLVSTLEPRKNHCGAFAAWLALAAERGEATMPRLVCVGGRGWLNDDLHHMLREHPALRRMVLILHGVPDDELATLYEHCLFALYPSLYEGWGLPVSEALAWGKVPAISSTSSMPEAGGVFARYFDPRDPAAIAAAVGALLDEEVRAAAETTIRRGYRPRTWKAIAGDILAAAAAAAPRGEDTLPYLSGAGTWTLALPGAEEDGRAPRNGEALRHGSAWQAPGPDGCRIQGNDAVLLFQWAGPAGAELHVRFAADAGAVASGAAAVRIGTGGAARDYRLPGGHLHPVGSATATVALPAAPATVRIPILPLAGAVAIETVAVVPAGWTG